MTLNRIKYIISSALFSVISLNAVQSQAGVDGSPFEGLYIGVATTKTTFESSFTHLARTDLTDPFNNPLISQYSNNNTQDILHKNSYGGGIQVGYGLNYGPIYFGAEAALIIDKGNTTFNDGTYDVKLSKSNTLDVNLRTGYTVANKVLIYGLVGFSGVNLKSTGLDERLDNGRDFNERITALRYGGGVEVSIFENIAARLEYTQTKMGDAVVLDNADQFTFKPKTSRIMFSLVLHMY